MTSRYAIRVYELLVQWRRRGHREVDIEWLRRALGVGDKYSNFKDFRRRVIEPAVQQVNERSPLDVSWEERKTGRRVSHVTFYFDEKPEVKDEKAEAAAKRNAKKEKKAAPALGDQPSMFGLSPAVIKEYARPGEDWQEAALRALYARQQR
nr:replication initiation protein [Halomonas azerica]